MRKLYIILLFLGCFLFVVGCDGPTKPNASKETTIQNPPPKDRFYLAFEVDGKPIINEHRGTPIFCVSSNYHYNDAYNVSITLREKYRIGTNGARLDLFVRNANLGQNINKPVELEFGSWEEFIKINETEERWVTYRAFSGTLTVTGIHYDASRHNGYLSGTFEMMCGEGDSIRHITNGVFNFPLNGKYRRER